MRVFVGLVCAALLAAHLRSVDQCVDVLIGVIIGYLACIVLTVHDLKSWAAARLQQRHEANTLTVPAVREPVRRRMRNKKTDTEVIDATAITVNETTEVATQ